MCVLGARAAGGTTFDDWVIHRSVGIWRLWSISAPPFVLLSLDPEKVSPGCQICVGGKVLLRELWDPRDRAKAPVGVG
jgi:hypothetical protein